MSGWLLMGLPGVAYWCGIADAAWTAIGLAAGTYINWLIVSKRLRRYSEKAGNAITLRNIFQTGFMRRKSDHDHCGCVHPDLLYGICGQLSGDMRQAFLYVVRLPYIPMMIVGAVFVLIYTIIGGFLAESASDFMQAIVMIVALGVIVLVGTYAAGGWAR